MKKLAFAFCAILLLGLAAPTASAVTINLFDFAFNLDGDISASPAGSNMAGFDTGTGLGTITVQIGTAGVHKFIAFFDHEIDEPVNTFFNEFGSVNGAPAAGQSWEIDEPGYVLGDIFTNFSTGTLDDTNGVPSPLVDDVSMALGWDLLLASNQIATINLSVSTSAPAGFCSGRW